MACRLAGLRRADRDHGHPHDGLTPAITHCYERPAFPDWPYTLYAMIHGDAEDTVRSIASAIANDFPEVPYTLLFSQKEYKKKHPRYFTEMA